MIVYDGCDKAIVGRSDCGRVVYEYHALVQVFIDQGMDHEGAVEWIDFNVMGLCLGDVGPIIMYPGNREMIDAYSEEEDTCDEETPG